MYPPILKKNRITLKPYDQSDEDRFVEIALDPASVQFMGGATGIEEDVRKLFNSGFEIYKRTDDRWFWLWGIYKDDLLCGHLELKETENTNEGELEVVYMVHPEERRKGIMTEVLSLLKENQHSWKKRVIATVDKENQVSISSLKKWGIDKTEIRLDDETGEESFKFILE